MEIIYDTPTGVPLVKFKSRPTYAARFEQMNSLPLDEVKDDLSVSAFETSLMPQYKYMIENWPNEDTDSDIIRQMRWYIVADKLRKERGMDDRPNDGKHQLYALINTSPFTIRDSYYSYRCQIKLPGPPEIV